MYHLVEMPVKRQKKLMVVPMCACIIFLIYINGIMLQQNNSAYISVLTAIRYAMKVENKTVVMLRTPAWVMGPRQPENMFDGCEISACRFYRDDMNKVPETDAVIIYGVGYPVKSNLTKTKPGQIWIFSAWESPIHMWSTAWELFRNKINWTMTYRLDSDIPAPYGTVRKISNPIKKDYTKIMAEKTKLVAQVVSNCKTQSQREKYIKTLNESIPVSVWGRCGQTRKKSTVDRFKEIEKSYKFYLSFENSLCHDYMTEKFFDRQNESIVPIVRGDGNYEHFYPKNSYIDARKFKSISDLAKYIRYLDRNDTAYLEYLKAKEDYVLTYNLHDTIKYSMCQVCKMLHNPEQYKNLYPDVREWYRNKACRKPIDLK